MLIGTTAESDETAERTEIDEATGPSATGSLELTQSSAASGSAASGFTTALTGIAVATAGLAQLATRRTEASRAIAWTLAGGVLMAHDWKDRAVWFRRGPQAEINRVAPRFAAEHPQIDKLSPGASTATFDFVFDSTSDLNASASVSIGGKVS